MNKATSPMRLYYVLNARMPHKKAYGIQVAKMCEAFIEAGVDLTLVVPRTRASEHANLKEFYHLRVDVPTVVLPALDRYSSGRAAFFLSALVFMVASFFYLLFKRMFAAIDAVYTIDMDTFSFTLLPLTGLPVVAEMHGSKSSNAFTRFFFHQATLVVATNPEIFRSLQSAFSIPDEKMVVEPNGVDLSIFEHVPDTVQVRKELGIPAQAKVALYTGRFFAWKELGILAEAAARTPDVLWYVVGGSAEEFSAVTGVKELPSNLYIVGECPHTEVPRWLAAADALLILGTKKNEQSYIETAPMKVYEYMAAERPVVASATAALRSFIPQETIYWYEPDDTASLSLAVTNLFAPGSRATVAHRSTQARAQAGEHTWKRRVSRILARLSVI